MRNVQGLIGPWLIISHMTNKTKLINQTIRSLQKHLNQLGLYKEYKTIITNQHFQATWVTMLARKQEVLRQVTKPLNDRVLFQETEMLFRAFRLWNICYAGCDKISNPLINKTSHTIYNQVANN